MAEPDDPQAQSDAILRGPPIVAPQAPRTLTEALLAGERPQAPRTLTEALMSQREPTTGERVQNAMSQVIQGALTDLPASMLGVSAVLGHGIVQIATDGKAAPWNAPLSVEELQTHKWSEAVRDFGKNLVREVPGVKGEFWADKLPRMFGALAPFGVVAKTVRVAEVASAAALGATLSAPEAYDQAKAGGADDLGAWAAFLAGGGMGASMALPVGRIFSRWDQESGGALKTILKDGLALGGQSSVASGVGAIAQSLATHQDIDVLKEAVASGESGFMAGLVLGAVGHGGQALIERRLSGEGGRDFTGKKPVAAEIPPVLRDDEGPPPPPPASEPPAPPPVEPPAPPPAEQPPPVEPPRKAPPPRDVPRGTTPPPKPAPPPELTPVESAQRAVRTLQDNLSDVTRRMSELDKHEKELRQKGTVPLEVTQQQLELMKEQRDVVMRLSEANARLRFLMQPPPPPEKAPEIAPPPKAAPPTEERPLVKAEKESIHPDLAPHLKPEDVHETVWPINTGSPATVVGYHGHGREAGKSVLAPGITENAMGDAFYMAANKKDASAFGPNVDTVPAKVENPLVITSTAELMRWAGVKVIPDESFAGKAKMLRDARRNIEDAGHDAVIIELPEHSDSGRDDKSNKILRRIFGTSQVILFHPEKAGVSRARVSAPPRVPDQEPNAPAWRAGRTSTLELADGKTLEVQYRLAEASELTPSHDARRGFKKNPLGDINERPYDDPTEGAASRDAVERIAGDPKSNLLLTDTPVATDGPPIATEHGVVLGGNARTMAMQLAYSRGGDAAAKLKASVIEAAPRFGLDASNMKEPVLVRVVPPEAAGKRGELSRVLNQSLTVAKTPTTEAVSRGAKITLDVANQIAKTLGDGSLRDALNDPARSRDLLRALRSSGAFTDRDLVELLDQRGIPTQAGKEIIEQALLGAAIPSVRTIAEMAPSTRSTFLKALPALVRMRSMWPEITDHLVGALDGLTTLRQSRQSIDESLRQSSLIDEPWKKNPLAVSIMRAYERDSQSAFGARLRQAADAVADVLSGQAQLFESGRALTPADAFTEALKGKENAQPETLVGSPGPRDQAPPSGGVRFTGPPLEAQRTEQGHVPAAEATPAAFAAGTTSDPVTGAPAGVRIGPMMTGTLAPAPVPYAKGPVSPVHVISAVQEALRAAGSDVQIRTGHVRMRWAAGYFEIWPGIIRVRMANHIPYATHELAHALEKAVFGWQKGGPWTNANVTRAVQAELERLGKELYGSRQPAGGYRREGWAEFVRYFVTQPEVAKAKAPELSKWFNEKFLMDHKEVGIHLDRAQELAQVWRNQGAIERGKAVIVDPSSPAYRYGMMRRAFGRTFSASNWLDMALPLEQVDRRMREILGASGAASIPGSPFGLQKALRGLHESVTYQFVHHVPVDLAGNAIPGAMSLVQAVAPAIGKRAELNVYMAARRIKEIMESDSAAGGKVREQPISYEDATYIKETIAKDHPEVELAAQNIYEWWEHVNNYAAQASPHFEKWIETTRAFDPGSFVPLQKAVDEVSQAWVRSGRSPARGNGGALIRRLSSSGLRIIDPLTSLVREADARISKAHREVVLNSLLDMHELAVNAAKKSPNPGAGIGSIITEIHPTDVKPFSVATERVIRELEAKLRVEIPDDIKDVARGSLTFFMPHYEADPNHMEVARWDRSLGKLRFYELDPELYKAIESMDVFRLPAAANFLYRAATISRNVFRFGTTARASFGLIANPTRDLQTLWINTQVHHNPVTLLAHWSQNMAALALHHFTGGKVSNGAIELFQRLGLEGQSRIGQDFYSAAETSRQAFQGWTRYMDPRAPWGFFLKTLQLPESASRMTEVKTLAERMGWKPGQPMSFEMANELRRAGKNATTDFTAAGEYARFWNQVVPFFNANIQGPRSNLASYQRNPAAFMAKAISLSMSTLALWYTQKDKEWYRQMNLRERFNYWHFEFSNNGHSELVRIPRAFAEGAAFAGTWEALADAAYTKDPSALKGAAQNFFEATTPNLLPPWAGETLAQAQNRDSFTGIPIVPSRELDAGVNRVAPAEQYDEYTSRMAIKMGEMFNVSPRRIHHAISGLFGRGGEDLVAALGVGPPESQREFEPADLPIVGHSIQRGGALGTNPGSVQHLYDMLERAVQIQNSRTTIENPQQRRTRIRLENAAQAIASASYVRLHTNSLEQRRSLMEMENTIAKEAVSDALGLSVSGDGRYYSRVIGGERKRIQATEREARLNQ